MAGPTAPSHAGGKVAIDLSHDADEDSDAASAIRKPSSQNPFDMRRPVTPPVDNEVNWDGAQPFNFDDFINFEDDAFPDPRQFGDAAAGFQLLHSTQLQNRRGEIIIIDGEEVFIPDESPKPEPVQPVTQPQQDHAQIHADSEAAAPLETENFTADTFLQRVLDIFPDISHEHVTALYNHFDDDISGLARFEQIIDKLVSSENYPKQERGKQKKRKRRDDDDDSGDERRWAGPHRDIAPTASKGSIVAMLKADFPEIPHRRINEELQGHTHFYQTYVALAKAKDGSESTHKWRGRRSSKSIADADTIAANSGFPALIEELNAARKKVQLIRKQRVADEAKKRAEHENLQRAIAAGELAECQACFEDLPMNRQVHCDGDAPHFTCFECLATYIKSEVGQSRCGVLCTAGCGAEFPHAQLHRLEDKELLEKLEQLQQEKAIRDAGIDDLEECPFCDYKAILPPLELDFEFRCANPECEKISCRRCKAVSHTPLSCEEHAKDNKLNSRHKIEEAMTAALLRSCNKCKKQFIKEYGCNKMTCSSCGNLQCYVCSQSLKNYNHFDQGGSAEQPRSNKCPLYDNVEERHEREVKEAEAAARRQILEENPNVTATDLEIKLSDAVSKATQDRINRGGHIIGQPPNPAHLLGGLFPMQRAGRNRLFNPADDDEHEDEDEDPFDVGTLAPLPPPRPRIRQPANRLAIPERLDDYHIPADPRLQQPRFPQPLPPVQQPTLQAPFGFQGYVPVLGFNPPVYAHVQPLGVATQPQVQPQQAPINVYPGYARVQPPDDFDVLNAFLEAPFRDPDANPFALHHVMNGPPYLDVFHPGGPQLAAGQQPGPAPLLAAQPTQPVNQQQQWQGQQQFRQDTAQRQMARVNVLHEQRTAALRRRQALQDNYDRADHHVQVQGFAPGDPRRYHQARGFPGPPQGG